MSKEQLSEKKKCLVGPAAEQVADARPTMLVGGVRSLVDTGGLTYSTMQYIHHSDPIRQSTRPAQQAWAGHNGWDGMGWVGWHYRGAALIAAVTSIGSVPGPRARHQIKKTPIRRIWPP